MHRYVYVQIYMYAELDTKIEKLLQHDKRYLHCDLKPGWAMQLFLTHSNAPLAGELQCPVYGDADVVTRVG